LNSDQNSQFSIASGAHLDSLVIADLFVLLFLGLADNQMIAALLPSLLGSLHVSVGVAGLLVAVYSLTAALASFISGFLSDHYGRRRFLLFGVFLFALASWTASRAGTFNELVLARALTGFAAGTISTCSITYAADWFEYRVRGRALGLISSAYFAAPILGVPLAAQIADRYGWRRAFLLYAILALATGALSVSLPKDRLNPEPSSDKLRAAGRSFRSFLVRRDTAAALGIAFLVSGGLVGFLTYVGQWLHSQFAISTRTIGWVFMLGGLVAVGSAPLGGIISDRIGKRSVAIAGNIILALAVALIPLLSWGGWLLAVFCMASLGAAFRQGALTALITELVPSTQRGAFIALRNIFSQTGIGIAAFLGGLLYERHGYGAVTTLCAVMTGLVVLLLITHIVEPQPIQERV
jgi:predicted MFS family arabinose efflux permease